MLFLLLVAAIVSHSPYSSQTVAPASCEGKVGLVSLSKRVFGAFEEKDHCPTKPPTCSSLQRPPSDCKDVDCKQWTLEMQRLPANGKGHFGILLPLWQALEQSVGQLDCGCQITQVSCSRTMARAPATKCEQKIETKKRWWQERWKRRKQGQNQKRWYSTWWPLVRTDSRSAATSRRSPMVATRYACSNAYTSTTPFSYAGECANEIPADSFEESKCRPASRCPGCDAKAQPGRWKVHDETVACRGFQFRQRKEIPCRALFSPCKFAHWLELFSGSSNHEVATLFRGVHPARSEPCQSDREGKGGCEGVQGKLPLPPEKRRCCQGRHSRRDFRRGGADCSVQSGRAYESDAAVSQDPERGHGRGASSCKASKARSWCSSPRWSRSWLYTLSLWWGRQLSDSFISCRPIGLQWAYAAVHLPDFLSPWHAIEKASDLSRELGLAPVSIPPTGPNLAPGLSHPSSAVTSYQPTCQPFVKQRTAKKVHFANFIGLRLSNRAQVADFTVAQDLLGSWIEKPWKLRPNTADDAIDTSWLMQTGLEIGHPRSGSACSATGDQLSNDILTWLNGLGRNSLPSSQLIASHGLSERSVGTRTFVLDDPRPAAFLEHLRATWPEYDDAVLRVHSVLPQPVDLAPQRHVVVEFLIHGFVPQLTPTLDNSIVWGAFGQTDLRRAAAYHEARLHHSDVTSPFSSLCTRAKYICTVRAQGRVLPLDFTRSISSGALIQLHAYPPSLHEPIEQQVPISGLAPFFTDSAELLGSFQLPAITWRFHLLQADGYHGLSESLVPATNLAAPLAVIEVARSLWISVPLTAVTYAGLSCAGDFDQALQDFIIFDPDSSGFPCLIRAWIDHEVEAPLPPLVAAFLPDACTLRDIAAALNALWLLELHAVSVEVSDGFLTYDHNDRFRPRHGASYIVLVKPAITDEISTFQTGISQANPPRRALASAEADLCYDRPARFRLLDEWFEQTTLPSSLVNETGEQAIVAGEEPLLIIDEWERLQHLLAEDFNQVDEIQLTMHGLFWTDIGCRFASSRPDIPSIREAVIRSWEDYFHGNLVGYLHLTIPQERLHSNELQLIVELKSPHTAPPEDGTPILRRITWHYLECDPQVMAVYQTSGMARSAFLAQAGLAQLCLATVVSAICTSKSGFNFPFRQLSSSQLRLWKFSYTALIQMARATMRLASCSDPNLPFHRTSFRPGF